MSTGGQYLSYQIKRADGQLVASGNCYLSGYDCDKPIYGLTAGTHTIVFTPQPAGVTASFNLRSWASSRVTGALTIGTANTYTSTVPGQMVVKTFNGTAGQQLGLSLSNFTTSVAGAQLYVIVNKPDGNNLLFSYFTASQTTPTPFAQDLPVLPDSGPYTVYVYPYQTLTNTMTTTFSGQVLVRIR